MPMSLFTLNNQKRCITYYATKLIGQGGQAAVWEGYYGYGVQIPVAIKVIGLASDPQAFDAWDLQQSIHLQCFGQPHIIQSVDQFISHPDGLLVLVMERAEGSAAELVDRGDQLSPIDICALGWQLGLALEFLDSIHVYHRDVTLRNVLRCANGIFKLCDFGISRANMSPEQVARTRRGTPGFVAPEHVRGEDVRGQSDIYQLGIVLLSLLIGRHPIPAGLSEAEVQQAILNGVPRQTAEQVASIYGPVAEIIYWMVARTLSKRFQTATQVRSAFEAEYHRLKAEIERARAPTSALPLSHQGIINALMQDNAAKRPVSDMARSGIINNALRDKAAANRAALQLPRDRILGALSRFSAVPDLMPKQPPEETELTKAIRALNRPGSGGLFDLGAVPGALPKKPSKV